MLDSSEQTLVFFNIAVPQTVGCFRRTIGEVRRGYTWIVNFREVTIIAIIHAPSRKPRLDQHIDK